MRGCSGVCVVAPWGAWMVAPGGVACMVAQGGCAWLLEGCMVAPGGHAWLLREACMVVPGGHAWLLLGRVCMGYHEIQRYGQ